MPRSKGKKGKFQYAEPPVFTYQTVSRDTRESLAYHRNPIFPDQQILFTDRFTNSRAQSKKPVASDEPETESLEKESTDEGRTLPILTGLTRLTF